MNIFILLVIGTRFKTSMVHLGSEPGVIALVKSQDLEKIGKQAHGYILRSLIVFLIN